MKCISPISNGCKKACFTSKAKILKPQIMNEDIRHDESEYYSFEGVGETGTKSCLQTECAAYIEKDTLVLAMDMKAYTVYCKKVITFMINFWMLAISNRTTINFENRRYMTTSIIFRFRRII